VQQVCTSRWFAIARPFVLSTHAPPSAPFARLKSSSTPVVGNVPGVAITYTVSRPTAPSSSVTVSTAV
jgi:hypothetical protein